MASLETVILREVDEAVFRASPAYDHRDQQVTAVRLASGAPCDAHAALFARWPGPQRDVGRWFALANGCAVGIRELAGTRNGIALWQPTNDRR